MALTPAARADVQRLYDRVGRAVAQASPRCEMSGRCCHFDEAGHELWSSRLEVEFALEHADGVPPAAPGRCPWHVDGLCTLRAGRPLGCRTYFCDTTWTEAGQALHEQLHGELVRLHDTHGVPYRYERFVDAVREPRLPTAPGAPGPPRAPTADGTAAGTARSARGPLS